MASEFLLAFHQWCELILAACPFVCLHQALRKSPEGLDLTCYLSLQNE